MRGRSTVEEPCPKFRLSRSIEGERIVVTAQGPSPNYKNLTYLLSFVQKFGFAFRLY